MKCVSQRAADEVEKGDPDLESLKAQFMMLEREFGKSKEEIAEVFCRVSGRLGKMRECLENRPVVDWNFLEDLALTKPDDTPEF